MNEQHGNTGQDAAATDKVAVIAIHGVGDPSAGSTAQSLTALLVAQEHYRHVGADQLLVKVNAVHPGTQAQPKPPWYSLFSSAFTAQRLGRGAKTPQDEDLHAGLARHLIEGIELDDADRVYRVQRERLAAPCQPQRQVDVLDLHWGDLSGLDNAAQRILTELYTLIFHLCQLGRDTVHHLAMYMRGAHPGHGTAARVLSYAQQWSDALLTKPSAVLNALLVLLTLWWLPLAAIGKSGKLSSWAVPGVSASAVIALLALLAWCYRPSSRARFAGAVAGLAVFGVALALAVMGSPLMVYWVAALWMLTLFGLFEAFLHFCEERVHGALLWGRVAMVAMVGVMLLGIRHRRENPLPLLQPAPLDWLAQAAGAGIEAITAALLVVWSVMSLAVLVTVLAGSWLKWRSADPVVSRSVDTGRIGLYASTALFVTLTVAAWTLAIDTVVASFGGAAYQPFYPGVLEATVGDFARARYADAALTFSIVLLVLAVLLGWLVAVLVPSVIAEFAAPAPHSDGSRLGRWLSGSGKSLTRWTPRVILFGAGVFIVWAVYATGAVSCGAAQLQGDATRLLCGVVGTVRQWSNDWLGWLLSIVAGSAAGLVVVGARVFGSLGKIRIALDAALDVDKHFREFPERATPRGRIAARVCSLLEATRGMGYTRVVLVAHSQGTIITTELLRYLSLCQPERVAALPPLYLLTCGCPLRQLYEARFPALYPWARTVHPEGATGPHADQLGVRKWTNMYCTGDYVGRWVWVPRPGAEEELLLTGVNLDDGTHRQICIGKGAHTHYYDTQQRAMADEVQALIAG